MNPTTSTSHAFIVNRALFAARSHPVTANDPIVIDLPGDRYRIEVTTHFDDNAGVPWKECDGHGPVSELVTRDKRAGERVLYRTNNGSYPRSYYYDFAEAVRIAKRDGWGLSEVDRIVAELLGRPLTSGEIAVAAVERDFQHLKDWCDGNWEYIGVCARLIDGEGNEIAQENLCRVESGAAPDGSYYWHDVAEELVGNLVALHDKELSESAEWAARGMVTV